MSQENMNIYLPEIVASLTVTTLCVVLLTAVVVILLSSIRVRRQLARYNNNYQPSNY